MIGTSRQGAAWRNGDVEGWAGYKVAYDVRSHVLQSGGVYVFQPEGPRRSARRTASRCPRRQACGVRLHHLLTVDLAAGTIDHVVNGVGDAVDNSNTGTPGVRVEYPMP